jgi:Holliday junction DNA helicase RuvB
VIQSASAHPTTSKKNSSKNTLEGTLPKTLLDNSLENLLESNTDNVRPQKLNSIIGQKKVVKQLQIILESSKIRKQIPEHMLFSGQPGLGKTTLAGIVANELGTNLKTVAAPSLQKVGDVISLLLSLEPNTVLFIDEIHALRQPLEESLYTAMEDGQVDLVLGKGVGSSTTRLTLEPFVLIGATTMLAKISKPLRDRFANQFVLETYSTVEILELIQKNSPLFKIKLDEEAEIFLASRARGVPRVVNNLLKRLRDYQVVHKIKVLSSQMVADFLSEIGVYNQGLTNSDLKYLESLLDGSRGLKTLSGQLLENEATIENVIEPYLIYIGFLEKGVEGRKLTPKGRNFILSQTNRSFKDTLFSNT